MKNVSLRELSRLTGYSVATVSKALRDHPDIRESTRGAIQEAAQKAGYARNARLSGVMAEIRDSAAAKSYDALACLLWSLDAQWLNRPSVSLMLAAARTHAKKLGWEVQTYCLNDPALPRNALARILHSRGIHAAIIFPVETSLERLDLDYSRLATVAIGYSVCNPPLCRVGRAALDSMETIFHELNRRGYKRPGLIIDVNEIHRTHRHPWAGFVTMQQQFPLEDRLPILTWETYEPTAFLAWIEQHKPDVIIGGHRWILRVLEKSGYKVPQDLGFVLFTRLENDCEISGLDPNFALLAENAVNLAVQMAGQARYGIPTVPQNLLVAGSWCEGKTLRAPLESLT